MVDMFRIMITKTRYVAHFLRIFAKDVINLKKARGKETQLLAIICNRDL